MTKKSSANWPSIQEFVRDLDERLGALSPEAVERRFRTFRKNQPETAALFLAVRKAYPSPDFPEEVFFFPFALHRYLGAVLNGEPPVYDRPDMQQACRRADQLFAREGAAASPLASVVFPNGGPLADFGILFDGLVNGLLDGGEVEPGLAEALRRAFAALLVLAEEAVNEMPPTRGKAR